MDVTLDCCIHNPKLIIATATTAGVHSLSLFLLIIRENSIYVLVVTNIYDHDQILLVCFIKLTFLQSKTATDTVHCGRRLTTFRDIISSRRASYFAVDKGHNILKVIDSNELRHCSHTNPPLIKHAV